MIPESFRNRKGASVPQGKAVSEDLDPYKLGKLVQAVENLESNLKKSIDGINEKLDEIKSANNSSIEAHRVNFEKEIFAIRQLVSENYDYIQKRELEPIREEIKALKDWRIDVNAKHHAEELAIAAQQAADKEADRIRQEKNQREKDSPGRILRNAVIVAVATITTGGVLTGLALILKSAGILR
jgi:hypothetical protein